MSVLYKDMKESSNNRDGCYCFLHNLKQFMAVLPVSTIRSTSDKAMRRDRENHTNSLQCKESIHCEFIVHILLSL